MRVLLAYAPHRDTFGYSMPPPGLLRLGGELLRGGRDVALEDLAYRLAAGELPAGDGLIEACARHLVASEPRVLGLSTMGATLPAALAIAAAVAAARPDTAIVLGGPGVTGIDLALLERFGWIDAVVRGEGERTLCELLDALEAEREPAGVAGSSWRAADGGVHREPDRAPLADLGELAPYAWSLLPSLDEYERLSPGGEKLVPIDSGRGCPYECSFCTIPPFWSRTSRVLPAGRLVEELAELAAQDAGRRAYLCHDVFGADRPHALALCEGLLARGIEIPWEVRARLDHLDPELIEAMGRAGCYRVLLGIESADPGVLTRATKRLDPARTLGPTVEALEAAGITPILSFVLGLPGEGQGELRATLDLAANAALRAGVQLSLHLPNPQPGCALGDEHGATSRPLEGIAPDMAFGAGETAPERALIAAHPDLFGCFALLTDLPGGEAHLRELAAIQRHLPRVLERFPRSFAMLGRLLGLDTLDTFQAWRAAAREFPSFARDREDPRLEALLEWECARLEVGASPPLRPTEHPRAAGRALLSNCDAPTLAEALIAGTSTAALGARATALFLTRSPRGVRTARISRELGELLIRLDGRTAPGELGLQPPLVARLIRRGLLLRAREERRSW